MPVKIPAPVSQIQQKETPMHVQMAKNHVEADSEQLPVVIYDDETAYKQMAAEFDAICGAPHLAENFTPNDKGAACVALSKPPKKVLAAVNGAAVSRIDSTI